MGLILFFFSDFFFFFFLFGAALRVQNSTTIAMADTVFNVKMFLCISADKVICYNTNIVVNGVQMNF